jgi:hypothetical protein
MIDIPKERKETKAAIARWKRKRPKTTNGKHEKRMVISILERRLVCLDSIEKTRDEL